METHDKTKKSTKPKKNWNGEIVKDEPWYEETFVTIDDAKITEGEAAFGLGGILIAVFLCVAIAAFCCDYKRKSIKNCCRKCCSTFRSSSKK
mgnify:CR=1 FL=1